MNYVIRKRCAQKITTFYRNVSRKYRHSYSLELMEKNVNDAGVNLPKAVIEWSEGNPVVASMLVPQYGRMFAKNDYLVEVK